jgi:hypothetical protein
VLKLLIYLQIEHILQKQTLELKFDNVEMPQEKGIFIEVLNNEKSDF